MFYGVVIEHSLQTSVKRKERGSQNNSNKNNNTTEFKLTLIRYSSTFLVILSLLFTLTTMSLRSRSPLGWHFRRNNLTDRLYFIYFYRKKNIMNPVKAKVWITPVKQSERGKIVCLRKKPCRKLQIGKSVKRMVFKNTTPLRKMLIRRGWESSKLIVNWSNIFLFSSWLWKR